METQDYGHGITILTTEDGMLAIVSNNGKTKKFKGETAWMDAERYAMDLKFKVMYA
jgi:hypothetical protein